MMPLIGSDNQDEQGKSLLHSAGRTCRTVAVAIIAGFRRKLGFDGVEARLTALPLREQVVLTALVLLGLFACSLFAAQFGLLGLAVFFAAVILLIR